MSILLCISEETWMKYVTSQSTMNMDTTTTELYFFKLTFKILL